VKYFLRIGRYLRPYRKLVALSVTVAILISVTSLLSPWPLKLIVDSVLGQQPLPWPLTNLGRAANKFNLLIATVAGGLLIVVAHNALTVLHSYINTRFEQRMILDFRSDMFQHAQRLSLGFHDRRRSGALIYAINFQADSAAGLITAIQPMAQSALTLIGMFWIMYRINHTLALLSLTVVPFLYYSVGYYATHIQGRLMKVKGLEGQSLSIVHEAMSMLRVIVAFGREAHEYSRFRQQGETAIGERIKLTVRQTMFSLVVNMITAIGTALVLGYGAYQAMQGKLTVGELLVVLTYIAAVYGPLEAISITIGSLQNHFVALRIAFNLMDTEPEIRDAPGAIAVPRVRGEVRFENIGFAYQGRVDTLKDISLAAEPGHVIAIAGPTGAGKSTLVSLLPRFYDPKSGRILLDGIDLRQIKLNSLREQISIVLQEPLLFSTSIAENIRYGRLEASQEEIVEAAKAANAHDFIMQLPKKYETVLGERGSQISGGERQRIAVARAFLKDAPILILDEPTSSIDSRTEAVILDALDRLMIGRTTFLIAHRLGTIRNADTILVMNHGEIVERGTHEELILKGGLYKQLYEMQTTQSRRRLGAPFQPVEPTTTTGT
jgi:ATP-binding cassette, subfamily B, bacterial